MSILFKELAGSPIETYSIEGMKAQRRLLAAFEDRYAVVAALMNTGQLSGPAQAVYPGKPGVIAVRVQVEPFQNTPDNQGTFDDLTADLNSYSGQFVEITVNYELYGDGRNSRLPQAAPGTLLTYRMDFGGEYVALPGQALQWESDATIPVLPEAVPTLRIPITEHNVTWHWVNDPPWDAIRACVGAVNSDSFLGAAAETVLFDGAKADRQFTGLDDLQQPQFGWRITYVFREKAIKALDEDESQVTFGWNHSYRTESAAGPVWDRLVDASGNTLYRRLDFSPLFQYPNS
ncbi:MAG: hypothetical protein ABSF26_19660 [Thermoguttaceae bacterium]|jgi:hypothetical protein